MMQIDLQKLNELCKTLSLEQRIKKIIELFSSSVCLASSLGMEDQILTHELLALNPKAHIFVLDTGRLNQETYNVMDLTMKTYHFNYRVYYPNQDAVEELVASKGPNSFYSSVENRKECCSIRKVEPLQRALKGYKAWITGLRQAQSVTRTSLNMFEKDTGHNLIKINPLWDWSYDQVCQHIKSNSIPYNILHDKGYPSIGCEPCTRAIKPGDDLRSGRWWWETPEQKECGLHVVNGKLVRQKNVTKKEIL